MKILFLTIYRLTGPAGSACEKADLFLPFSPDGMQARRFGNIKLEIKLINY